MKNEQKKFRSKIKIMVIVPFFIMLVSGIVFANKALSDKNDTTTVKQTVVKQEKLTAEKADVSKFALVAAAVAFGCGALAAGIAISHVGAAAMGAIAEKPEIAGQALIFIALAEGLVVFGFITALMFLGKV